MNIIMTQKLIKQDIFILIGLFTSTKMELPSIIKWIFWVRLKKEILVFTIPKMQFSLLYLIENATQEKITKLFDSIEREIGTNNFRKLFSAILTDRVTVFDDFASLEFNSDGILRTKIFFCNQEKATRKLM